MGCERPDGPFIDMVRDNAIKFPPNWVGELPPQETRVELRTYITPGFARRRLSAQQIEEVLDFFVAYEARCFEAPGGQCYHRSCDGGAMVEGETGVFCAKCGRLPDLLPPACMR